jgi:heptose I phosphotransferase
MLGAPSTVFRLAHEYQPIFREIGLDADAIFRDPRIAVWRSITERQNCTLDVILGDGREVRFHIKRYLPARGYGTPAEDEARGIRALEIERIPTAPLVGWGKLKDGRSFIITENLAGYRAADKLIPGEIAFDQLLEPTADLAARLHKSGLHHRDLYLCHFFVKPDGDKLDLKLIDAARVARLPPLFARRWIVKDLAQFFYSTLSLGVTDDQRTRWLARYGQQRGLSSVDGLRRSIERKVRWIARHDAKLKAAQPKRNISIPGA